MRVRVCVWTMSCNVCLCGAGGREFVVPSVMLNAVICPTFRLGQQQDVHEFYMHLSSTAMVHTCGAKHGDISSIKAGLKFTTVTKVRPRWMHVMPIVYVA